MSSKPLISILMNCFNGERYLRQAIESVLLQTFGDWELLFWDNQSTDKSAEIVENYTDTRIRYFRSQEHTTLGEARELARGCIRGKWLTVLDVDDYWLPENLESRASVSVESDVGLIYSRYVVDRTLVSESSFVMPLRRRLSQGQIYSDLTEKNFIGFHTALYRADAVESVGGFRPLPYSSDYDLNLRIAQKWPVKAVDQVVAVYRIHGKNRSVTEAKDMLDERAILISQMPADRKVYAWSGFFVDCLRATRLSAESIAIFQKGASIGLILLICFKRFARYISYRLSAIRKYHRGITRQIVGTSS